ncbi:MAG: TIGR01777 family protein [Deltaproteobacteria bacterium]|nr:TIGR01777 family protein [Deltaproteobacteria bacterium]
MKILITGATGLIGSRLSRQLHDLGHEIVITSRDRERAIAKLPFARDVVEWDPVRTPAPAAAFAGVEAVVNLMGEPVAGRWTAGRKRAIRDSRVLGTRNLVEGMRGARQSVTGTRNLVAGMRTAAESSPNSMLPEALVSASAIGYYGEGGDRVLAEDSRPGEDFLARVCVDWEGEAARAVTAGARVVIMRTGLVLAREGGALASMLPIFKAGFGGRLGSGRQWMSWIHVDDLVALYVEALTNPAFEGPLNAVAPGPVTNSELTETLARALRRPAVLPAPAFALKLALGEMAGAVLESQRVIPRAAVSASFRFKHETLEAALRALLKG